MYLPKSKWEDIKEEQAYNWSVRKTRLDQALTEARQENEEYLENVEKNKVKKRVKAKEAKKRGAAGGDEPAAEEKDEKAAKHPRRDMDKTPAACSSSLLSKIIG